MAACLYRRAGVPFVRVPTTLLAIVDASVGVNKNGVSTTVVVPLTNPTGTASVPSMLQVLVSFIASQDMRKVFNGFGEILSYNSSRAFCGLIPVAGDSRGSPHSVAICKVTTYL